MLEYQIFNTALHIIIQAYKDVPRHMTSSGIEYGWIFNLLKPTGYVMHQQFNIQQF